MTTATATVAPQSFIGKIFGRFRSSSPATSSVWAVTVDKYEDIIRKLEGFPDDLTGAELVQKAEIQYHLDKQRLDDISGPGTELDNVRRAAAQSGKPITTLSQLSRAMAGILHYQALEDQDKVTKTSASAAHKTALERALIDREGNIEFANREAARARAERDSAIRLLEEANDAAIKRLKETVAFLKKLLAQAKKENTTITFSSEETAAQIDDLNERIKELEAANEKMARERAEEAKAYRESTDRNAEVIAKATESAAAAHKNVVELASRKK